MIKNKCMSLLCLTVHPLCIILPSCCLLLLLEEHSCRSGSLQRRRPWPLFT